ncbi:ATP-dependent RNA helicase TDRD9-like, partial [Lingula anatina]|uniref:ATP-dependent RNA helicase TDRD9-like n=1 Tax=Lingula anatina TaxID=7574 RepID=A0A2R2MP31_LINAN
MSRLGAELTLEQVDDWFRIGRAVPKVQTVPRSKSGGRELNQNMQPIVKPARPYVPRYKRHTREGNPYQTQYAKHYQDVENSQLISGGVCTSTDQSLGRDSDTSHQLDLEGISDTMSTVSFLPEEPPNSTAVYRNYNFEHTYDKNLPITHYHEDVVDTIESNRVTVIQGSTGSGKTTQVPQYILDHYAQAGKYCNIVVTQPRRIAAMSIARRVCQERGWRLGSVVGYQ